MSALEPAQEPRSDPCWEPTRLPTATGPRLRVVQLLATGTNGGAQEQVFALATRLDASRYEVSVVSLSPGNTVRKLERAGIPAVDVGNPMLAMHSCRELAGTADVQPMIDVLRLFYQG